jgi:hypothetical protein
MKICHFFGDLLNVVQYGNINIAYSLPNGLWISTVDRQIQMSLIWIHQVWIEQIRFPMVQTHVICRLICIPVML